MVIVSREISFFFFSFPRQELVELVGRKLKTWNKKIFDRGLDLEFLSKWKWNNV